MCVYIYICIYIPKYIYIYIYIYFFRCAYLFTKYIQDVHMLGLWLIVVSDCKKYAQLPTPQAPNPTPNASEPPPQA